MTSGMVAPLAVIGPMQKTAKNSAYGSAPAPQAVLLLSIIALLVFGVVSFSTLAKDSAYLPKSNPTHQVSVSKLDVSHVMPAFEEPSSGSVARLILPPPASARGVDPPMKPLALKPDFAAYFQHRAPPST